MPYADEIETAITVMRADLDRRWHAVADLLENGPLGYARMVDNRPEVDRPRWVARYPDAEWGRAVARAYLNP